MTAIGRRRVLRFLGLGSLASAVLEFTTRGAQAYIGHRLLAAKYLEEASYEIFPAGYYDPRCKMYISQETNEPVLAQQRATMTANAYRTCVAYDQKGGCQKFAMDGMNSDTDVGS